jgi:hypothetical protein
MSSVLKKSYGNRDFNLGELRNFRLHVYATLAAMNADVSSAQARVAYCIETDRTYFGKTGAWVGLANATGWQDTVANTAALPVTEIDGAVRVVLNDGTSVGPTIWVYSTSFGGWHKQADPRVVLANGTVKFSAIPGVASGAVVPVAPTDLVTKAYADAGGSGLATHIADPAAHATAINSSVAAHDGSGAAHSALFAATAAAATSALNTHKSDSAAHSAAIASAVAAGIATHDANSIAHLTEINSLIAAHNTDVSAHATGIAGAAAGGSSSATTSGGADGALSLSGQNVVEGVCVVGGGHGTPCTTRPFESVYRIATEVEEPCGLVWRSSTPTAFGSGSVVFNNATPKITVPTASGLLVGQIVTFVSSVLNAGKYFTITSIISGTDIGVSPAPVNETVATAMTAFACDGVVVFNGRFAIDLSVALGSLSIQSMTASVSGKGRITFTSLSAIARIRPGDSVVITGSIANNGTYTVSVVEATNSVLLTTVLPANQGSAAGSAAFSHTGQTNNFSAFTLSTETAKTWYTDDVDPLKYSSSVGSWELGQQVNSFEFIVGIKPAGGSKSTVNNTASLIRKNKQYVFVDAGASFTVTLFSGFEGDEVIFIHSAGSLVTNNCTISTTGGQQIAPAASSSYIMDTNGQSVTLKFISNFWRLL